MKFRKKPVVIDAVRWVGTNLNEIAEFASGVAAAIDIGELMINTSETEHLLRADPGDWIIRDAKGDFYSCKPDIFEATYERDHNADDGE